MEEKRRTSQVPEPPVIVTDDREAHPRWWLVARVRMNCEKQTALKISQLGIETFLPVKEVVRQWADRKKRIEKVLLPLLVFFRADDAEAKTVLKLSSVYELLKAPGERQAARIPDYQVQRLKFMIGHSTGDLSIREAPRIVKGDRVRVVRGSLKGLEGYATTTPEGGSKISIIIENLFCASVTINPLDLQKL